MSLPLRTDDGLVAFLTLGLGGEASLSDAHALASAVEERVREAVPGIADVVVHTEREALACSTRSTIR